MTGIYVDNINESTSANGVSIDGLKVKDYSLMYGSNIGLTISSNGYVTKPNQPIFSANRSGKSNLTATQIIDWTEVTNQGNHFRTSTNRFTCPVAGKYYCSFYSITNTAGTSTESSVFIRINGTNTYSAYSDTVSTVNYLSYSATGLFDCSANDILDFYNNSGTVYAGIYSGAVIYLVG